MAIQDAMAYQQQLDAANKANEFRYQQMMKIYDSVIQQYQPGGSFGMGAEALYQSGKSQAIALGMQNLVSNGLSNTTIAAALPIKYEEEVGTPFRLQLEDMRMSRLAEAQIGKASAMERRTDQAPDPSLMAKLYEGAAANPRTVSPRTVGDVNTNSFVERNRTPSVSSFSPYGTSSGVTYGKSRGKSTPIKWDKGYDYTPSVFNARAEYDKLMQNSPYTPGKATFAQLGAGWQAGVSPLETFNYKPTESQLANYFNPKSFTATGSKQTVPGGGFTTAQFKANTQNIPSFMLRK